MELCKDPSLAYEVTMGPIRDFDFDAAILFSDLLFPLEQLGMGLTYSPGPKLAWHLNESNVDKLEIKAPASEFYQFQARALSLLKESLPQHKSLLGFVGGPFTLYTYAVEGGHAGALWQAKRGSYSGLYQQFLERLLPQLLECMAIQANGGADVLCIFDTAAGELTLQDFKRFVLPALRKITQKFKRQFPAKKIVYYSKQTSLDYLLSIEDEHIDVLGFDWRVDIAKAFQLLSDDYYLQGNFDPCWLHLSWEDCHKNLREFVQQIDERYLEKWIFGLGHGVLVQTPEENVRKTVDFIHNYFSCNN